MDRDALHDPAQLLGEGRGGGIAALLGQLRVAGDVEEAHRRRRLLLADMQARLLEGGRDTLDDIRRPHMRLLGVVDRHQRAVRGVGEPRGNVARAFGDA